MPNKFRSQENRRAVGALSLPAALFHVKPGSWLVPSIGYISDGVDAHQRGALRIVTTETRSGAAGEL